MAKSSEFVRALLSLAGERKIPEESLRPLVEEAIGAAATSVLKADDPVVCVLDLTNETVSFHMRHEDDSLEELPFEVTDLGRSGAQRAMSELQQRLRKLEEEQRLVLWTPYIDTIVPGTLRKSGRGALVVEIGNSTFGFTEASFPSEEQIRFEEYRSGHVMEFYLKGFTLDFPRNVIVSRRDPRFILRLMEGQVHELASGDIHVEAIARDAGVRTKIAVATSRPDVKVDPVAACVGARGSRINALRHKVPDAIDVFAWSDDPATLITSALGVEGVERIEIHSGDARLATVYVPEALQAKAIGKNGQNVRLASAISGYRIDVKGAKELTAEKESPATATLAPEVAATPKADEVTSVASEISADASSDVTASDSTDVESRAVEPVAAGDASS